MSGPTKAIAPLLLEDMRKVSKGGGFTYDDIVNCLNKCTALELGEVVECEGIKIKTYYAGHVLGACTF